MPPLLFTQDGGFWHINAVPTWQHIDAKNIVSFQYISAAQNIVEFQRTTELFNSCAPGEHQVHVAEHLLRLLGDPTAQPAPLTRHQGAVLRSILAERRATHRLGPPIGKDLKKKRSASSALITRYL